jgi:predicted  nucleic acid-binding Zn-ribbon protein
LNRSHTKKEVERLSRERERLSSQIRASETEISRAQIRLGEAESKASIRARALADKEKLETEKLQLQERLDSVDKKMREAEPALTRLRKEFRSLQDANKEAEEVARSMLDSLSKGMEQLGSAMKVVEE